jgi:predicted nuclease of predicted toxin-antitoxin system
MRLLVDMNLTPRWIHFPSNAGHDAVPWSSVGPICAKDSEFYHYARHNGQVILTNDLDFPQILAHTRQTAPSVVPIRGEPLVPEIRGGALLGAPKDCEAELNQGAIVTLDRSDRPRARVLPLRWIPHKRG